MLFTYQIVHRSDSKASPLAFDMLMQILRIIGSKDNDIINDILLTGMDVDGKLRIRQRRKKFLGIGESLSITVIALMPKAAKCCPCLNHYEVRLNYFTLKYGQGIFGIGSSHFKVY